MMRCRIKANDKKIVEFLMIWLLFQAVITSSLLKYSSYESLFSIIRIITNVVRVCLIIVGIFFLSKEKIKKNFLIPLVLYAILVIVTKTYNDSYQFLDALFIAFVFKNKIKRERWIDLFFWTILISTVVVVLAYLFGMFPHYAVRRFDGRERIFLGFAHPNSLGYYVMILSFLGILRIRKRIRYYNIVLLMVASWFVYVYPNSFSSAICILLLAVYLIVDKLYSFFFKTNIIRNKFVQYGAVVLVPIIILLIYWFVANASNSMLANESLSTFYARFRLGNQAIERYGIHLFGSKNIEIVGTAERFFKNPTLKYFTIDCFYIQVLVKYGIIPTVLFLIYYISCVKVCIKEKDADVLILLIIMAIYSINESMLFAIPSSFLFIIASSYLWKDNKEKIRRNMDYGNDNIFGLRRV